MKLPDYFKHYRKEYRELLEKQFEINMNWLRNEYPDAPEPWYNAKALEMLNTSYRPNKL